MFRNREDAAFRLAAVLKNRTLHDPLVLAIPRGGVVTGAILAHELDAELDVVLCRKLRAPGHPELAIGVVAEGGAVYLDGHEDPVRNLGPYLARERDEQLAEIERRAEYYRKVRPPARLAGRSVIVADDGIATGSTMIAALKLLRRRGLHELIAAVPVAPSGRLAEVRRWCDEVVCLGQPPGFGAVGEFYGDFEPVSDAQVVALLRDHGFPESSRPGSVQRHPAALAH